jgi:tripartite-type tricarboxylate transporter receptor subunit TctC
MDVAMKSRTSRMAMLMLLVAAFATGLADSLARLGAEPNFGTPESFGATIAAEIPKWAETVRAAGIRLD